MCQCKQQGRTGKEIVDWIRSWLDKIWEIRIWITSKRKNAELLGRKIKIKPATAFGPDIKYNIPNSKLK